MLEITKITVSEFNNLETHEEDIIIKKLIWDRDDINIPVLCKKIIINSVKFGEDIWEKYKGEFKGQNIPMLVNMYCASFSVYVFLKQKMKIPFNTVILLKGTQKTYELS